MRTAYQKGIDAETLAARYFKKQGYKLLETRYKTRYGEIDVVALKGDMLVFVEVKSRKNLDDSLYAITPKNRKRVEQAALHFVAEHPDYADYGMRFDVFGIGEGVGDESGEIVIRHLDNAWEAGQY